MKTDFCVFKKRRLFVFVLSALSLVCYCVSCVQSDWLKNEMVNATSHSLNLTHFGIWQQCNILINMQHNGTIFKHLEICTNHDAVDYMQCIADVVLAIRIFLIATIVITAESSLFTALFVFTSDRPLVYISGLPLSCALIAGGITACILSTSLLHSECIKDFTLSNTPYYILAAWISAFLALCIAINDKYGRVQSAPPIQDHFSNVENIQ